MRADSVAVATLAIFLHKTAAHPDAFKRRAPRHDWRERYGHYLDALQRGCKPDEASRAADRSMEEVRHVISG